MARYPNNHYPKVSKYGDPQMEPCPYLATGTPAPDDTCTLCHGTNGEHGEVSVGRNAIAWSCQGCGLEGPMDLFELCCCLQYGAGYFEELRACHEAGDHDLTGTVQVGDGPKVPWRLDKKRCPLCIERKIVERTVVKLLLVPVS